MRKLSLTVVALAGFSAGCTSTANQVGPGGTPYAQNPQYGSQNAYANVGGPSGTTPYAGALAANAPQPASFTEKVTNALTTNPFAGADAPAAQQEPLETMFADNSKPPTAELYVSMATVCDQSGNAPQARLLYQRALSLEKGNVEAMLGLAHLEDRAGNLDIALKIYQDTVRLNPQNPKALNDLGLCLARQGDLQSSLQVLDQAVRLQPDKALYRNNIAKVLIELNMINPALSHLAAVHGPPIAEYNVGVLLNQRGRKAEAIEHLNTALRLDPKLQPAAALLSELAPQEPAANAPEQFAQQMTASRVTSQQAIEPTPGLTVSAPQRGVVPQLARAPQTNQPGYYQSQPAQAQPYQAQSQQNQPRPAVDVPGVHSSTPVGQTQAGTPSGAPITSH